MNLKLYRPLSKDILKYPFITIHSDGISFNKICFPVFQNKRYIEILYDKDLKIIAFRPYHRVTDYMFKINNYREKEKLVRFSGVSFLKEFHILEYLKIGKNKKIKSRKFKAKWDDKEKWFLIDLKNPVVSDLEQPKSNERR